MLDQRPVHWPPAAWIHWTQTAPASHLHQPTDNYTTIPHLHQSTDNYTTISNNVTADTPALVSHAKAAFSVVATWLSLHQNTSHCHLGYCNTLLYSSGFKKKLNTRLIKSTGQWLRSTDSWVFSDTGQQYIKALTATQQGYWALASIRNSGSGGFRHRPCVTWPVMIFWLMWVVVLCPTRHKIGHFKDISPSQKTKHKTTKARIHQSKEWYYNTNTKARCSRLLPHPTWQWSGSILKGKDK